MDLDGRGLPGGFIASTEFIEAAEAQAQALGFEANRVFIPHPIQDRTDEEVQALADTAMPDILALLGLS